MFPVQTVDSMLRKIAWHKSVNSGGINLWQQGCAFLENCEARYGYTKHSEPLFSLCAAEFKKKKKRRENGFRQDGHFFFPFLVSLCVTLNTYYCSHLKSL